MFGKAREHLENQFAEGSINKIKRWGRGSRGFLIGSCPCSSFSPLLWLAPVLKNTGATLCRFIVLTESLRKLF